jgi:hypothetical protein
VNESKAQAVGIPDPLAVSSVPNPVIYLPYVAQRRYQLVDSRSGANLNKSDHISADFDDPLRWQTNAQVNDPLKSESRKLYEGNSMAGFIDPLRVERQPQTKQKLNDEIYVVRDPLKLQPQTNQNVQCGTSAVHDPLKIATPRLFNTSGKPVDIALQEKIFQTTTEPQEVRKLAEPERDADPATKRKRKKAMPPGSEEKIAKYLSEVPSPWADCR